METNLSPWPDEGKTVQFKFRKAVWLRAFPWYGANNVIYTLDQLESLAVYKFWFPFFTVFNKWFHLYVGWKPIPPHLDGAFYWNKLKVVDMTGETLYVQLSCRWGFGTAR